MATEEKEQDELSTGPLSVLMSSVKLNHQVSDYLLHFPLISALFPWS